MPDAIRLSVILPCRNEVQHIEDCLRSVLAQKTGFPYEVLVADGMSTDGTREILSRLCGEVNSPPSADPPLVPAPDFQVSSFIPHPSETAQASAMRPPSSIPVLRTVDNPSRIVPTGLNAAIRQAKGDIVIRFDAHTEYAPDYIQQCVEVLNKIGADNVGGPARTKADTLLQKAIAAAYHSPFSVGGARFHDVDYEGYVDTVTYGCWRKEAFQEFGYFDEELVRNQDDEHNLRITRGGGKIYQSPKIKSWYKPRSSLTALFKQYMQYGYWKVRVIQKHKLPASWRHLVPGAFVLTLALLFLLSTFSFLIAALTSDVRPLTSGLLSSGFGSHPSSLAALSFQLSAFCFVFGLSSYALAVIAASLHTAAKAGWKLLPLLPLVFPCYHFGYGIGFLRGIWDFVIRKKGAHKKFEALTR
jgi:glycosyltransferase involved in cell wall biosynthesis